MTATGGRANSPRMKVDSKLPRLPGQTGTARPRALPWRRKPGLWC